MVGAYASTLWCSVRSYEVFAVVVFGSRLKSSFWKGIWNVICWGVPIVVSVAAISTDSFSFIATYFCGPKIAKQSGLILYPLIVISFGCPSR
jgi:hypothetical protein